MLSYGTILLLALLRIAFARMQISETEWLFYLYTWWRRCYAIFYVFVSLPVISVDGRRSFLVGWRSDGSIRPGIKLMKKQEFYGSGWDYGWQLADPDPQIVTGTPVDETRTVVMRRQLRLRQRLEHNGPQPPSPATAAPEPSAQSGSVHRMGFEETLLQ
jgi:hypothetical protein